MKLIFNEKLNYPYLSDDLLNLKIEPSKKSDKWAAKKNSRHLFWPRSNNNSFLNPYFEQFSEATMRISIAMFRNVLLDTSRKTQNNKIRWTDEV